MLYLLGGAFLLGALGGWVAGLLRDPRLKAARRVPQPPAQPHSQPGRQERA
ncbi:MAG: hypothetical protein M3P93_15215 [Actinomycetota bacterium]|nr:hypothetical protein [Actinomycetota bacterium]